MLDIAIIQGNQSKQYLMMQKTNLQCTNNWDQHQKRLNKFVESKQIGIFFYLGPKLGFITLLIEVKKFIDNEMFTANFTS